MPLINQHPRQNVVSERNTKHGLSRLGVYCHGISDLWVHARFPALAASFAHVAMSTSSPPPSLTLDLFVYREVLERV